MTARALATSMPAAHPRRAVPPEVCPRSPFPDINHLSYCRHRSILYPNPSRIVSIPAVRPRLNTPKPHSKRSSISDTAPFK